MNTLLLGLAILLASIATARATVDVYYVCRPGLTEIITDEGGIRGSTGFWRGKNGMAQKRLPTRLFREKGNTLYYRGRRCVGPIGSP
jgi:hypothetical protein